MTVMGIDWGAKRIGLAISDPVGIVAVPLSIIDGSDVKKAIDEILAICADKNVEKIVIGQPLNMDGTTGMMTEKVDVFTAELERIIPNIPIVRWDERLSTAMADKFLIDAELDNRKRKIVRDKVAAQVILQGYLDATL